MKYIITEGQFDKIVFRYLNNQDFIQIEKKNRIYFVNSEGDEYAQIRYDKSDELCYIKHNLVNEISSFFSLEVSDSEQTIGRWVENTLQMKVGNIVPMKDKIENTLQMKVRNFSEWSVDDFK
jgi:hypothetical protein